MKQLHNIVSPFNDLELNGTPFTINELGNTIGIDKHRYDNDIGWDADVQQKIYRSLFQNKNAWQFIEGDLQNKKLLEEYKIVNISEKRNLLSRIQNPLKISLVILQK